MMRFNFRKISAMATSALMAVSSVGFAAAASYPAPFVQNGVADVAIVYGTGEGVSSLDIVQGSNIQTNLQSFMGSATTGGTTTTVSGGDSVLLAKSSDNLNLGDGWSVFTGTIDDDDLSTLLADGTYVADDNDEFDYEQKISLGNPTLTHFRDSDYESLAGLSDRTPTVGFKIGSNTHIMNYTLDFTQDAESDIVGTDIDDISGSDIPLMGKNYYVSSLKNGTTATLFGKLTLLDSANVATVAEGETVTVSSGDSSYEVSINYLDNDEVRFVVNGQMAPSSGKLTTGQTYRLSDNSYIGARDISKLEVAGESGSATFSIGSGKLEITSSSDIKLNDDTINGVKAWVYKTGSTTSISKIDKIVVEWKTDEEEFVSPVADLSMPGFNAVKFSMNNFVRADEEKITLVNDGDDSMELTLPIKDGEVSFNILYANTNGNFTGIGKSATERLATGTGTTLVFHEKDGSGNDYHDWMVATYNISQEAESYLLRAKVTKNTDAGRNETDIEKNVDGTWTEVCSDKTNGDTCDLGDVTLTITTVAFTAGGGENVTFTAGTNVNFNTIFTAGGLRIDLPYAAGNGTTANGAINFSDAGTNNAVGHNNDIFYLFMDGENKDEDIAGGTQFSLTVNDNTDNELQISQMNTTGGGAGSGTGGTAGLEIGSTNTFEAYVIDDVAPRLLHHTNPDQDWAEVYYPGGSDSESYAEVFLSESNAVISGGTSTGGATQLGDVLVKDSEVSSVSSKNLILVGGSCINSAAANVLGGAFCGSAFTDATTVGPNQFLIKSVADAYASGKIALVVAGYEAADTQNAATYLTTQTVDTGSSYKGTSATSAEMMVEETA